MKHLPNPIARNPLPLKKFHLERRASMYKINRKQKLLKFGKLGRTGRNEGMKKKKGRERESFPPSLDKLGERSPCLIFDRGKSFLYSLTRTYIPDVYPMVSTVFSWDETARHTCNSYRKSNGSFKSYQFRLEGGETRRTGKEGEGAKAADRPFLALSRAFRPFKRPSTGSTLTEEIKPARHNCLQEETVSFRDVIFMQVFGGCEGKRKHR